MFETSESLIMLLALLSFDISRFCDVSSFDAFFVINNIDFKL